MNMNLVDTVLYKKVTLGVLTGDNEDAILDNCAKMLSCNIDIILFNTFKEDILSVNTGRKIRQLCSIYNACYLVKSRADIAVLTFANGILLDKNDYSITDSRKIISHDMIAGTTYFDKDSDFMVINEETNGKYVFVKSSDNIYKLASKSDFYNI